MTVNVRVTAFAVPAYSYQVGSYEYMTCFNCKATPTNDTNYNYPIKAVELV